MCLEQLMQVSQANVVLITAANLHTYILYDHPLHAAYHYLSETHKADYLRTYFMHFYGGGYSDIKRTTGSWIPAFEELERREDIWACGYKELQGGVGYEPYADKWAELIGNCAYICKPRTPLTTAWYTEMMRLLDSRLGQLILHPAKGPQDPKEYGGGYPIEWGEMLGRIFHKVSYDFKGHVINTLPSSVFWGYR